MWPQKNLAGYICVTFVRRRDPIWTTIIKKIRSIERKISMLLNSYWWRRRKFLRVESKSRPRKTINSGMGEKKHSIVVTSLFYAILIKPSAPTQLNIAAIHCVVRASKVRRTARIKLKLRRTSLLDWMNYVNWRFALIEGVKVWIGELRSWNRELTSESQLLWDSLTQRRFLISFQVNCEKLLKLQKMGFSS